MRYSTVLYACLLLAAVDAKKKKKPSQYPRPPARSRVKAIRIDDLSELPAAWAELQARRDAECRANPHYICKDDSCIDLPNARCDGIKQCADDSDEDNCPAQPSPTVGENSSVPETTTTASIEVITASSSPGCILPEQLEGERFELGSCQGQCNIPSRTRLPIGSFLVYSCNEGYILRGNNISICYGEGTWFSSPTCVKTCPVPKSESVDFVCRYQGEIVSCKSNIMPGTKAILSCKTAYKISLGNDFGYREIICLEGGEWDRPIFHCIPECGTAAGPVNPLIINGQTAKHGEFPWHVGIYIIYPNGKYDQICGGTLVSPNLVISAAHCFYDEVPRRVMNASRFSVAAGKYYRPFNIILVDPYAQTSQIKKIDITPRYSGRIGNFAQDIALVHLQTRFNISALIKPICIDWDNDFEGEQLQSGRSGKVVGWGTTAAGVPSVTLQVITLPYIPYNSCIAAVEEDFKGFVTPDKFCAGYLNGSSLCNGDSGGGLCFQLYGLWYLRGIVSVGPSSEGTCDRNYYTAFTNVGHYLEWIRAAYLSAG